METQLVGMDYKTFLLSTPVRRRRDLHRSRHPPPPSSSPTVLSVLTRPTNGVKKVTNSESVHIHKDSLFDRIAINHLSLSVQNITGLRNNKCGYESLVEAAMVASRSFNPIQQRQVTIKALHKAIPTPILFMIRTLLPNSKFARAYFAIFTTVFFKWLVGPCEVRESELNGRREKNVVHIKKCRFLEESNCVGTCINLCKMPSQTFIKNSLGMPINMIPNFDDMSCEMIYGQDPPPPAEDPVFKQPCYKLCKAKQRHDSSCSS